MSCISIVTNTIVTKILENSLWSQGDMAKTIHLSQGMLEGFLHQQINQFPDRCSCRIRDY
ncbi:2242_t:CDS:2, partial [Entrophospora sp. SA101]